MRFKLPKAGWKRADDETRIEEFLRTKPYPSRKTYRARLKGASDHMKANDKRLDQIDQGYLRDHVSRYASETGAQTLKLVRQFGHFDGWPEDHPIFDPYLKVRKTRPRKLSYVDEDSQVLMLSAQDNTTLRGVYQTAFMMTIFDTGARIKEMVAIELQDVDFKRCVVTLNRKGGDWDPTSFTDATMLSIQAWLPMRRELLMRRWMSHAYLFPAIGGRQPGAPMTARGAASMVKDIAQSVGLNKITAHSSRRGTAIWLYLKGVPRPQIIEHLGWKDGKMLDYYIRHFVPDEDVRKYLPGNLLEVSPFMQREDIEMVNSE